MFGSGEEQNDALNALVKRGNPDVDALAWFSPPAMAAANGLITAAAIGKLTGTKINDWADGMLWIEANPEIKPHASYKELKLNLFKSIDRQFPAVPGQGTRRWQRT